MRHMERYLYCLLSLPVNQCGTRYALRLLLGFCDDDTIVKRRLRFPRRGATQPH